MDLVDNWDFEIEEELDPKLVYEWYEKGDPIFDEMNDFEEDLSNVE